jgi:hypothetical protein
MMASVHSLRGMWDFLETESKVPNGLGLAGGSVRLLWL